MKICKRFHTEGPAIYLCIGCRISLEYTSRLKQIDENNLQIRSFDYRDAHSSDPHPHPLHKPFNRPLLEMDLWTSPMKRHLKRSNYKMHTGSILMQITAIMVLLVLLISRLPMLKKASIFFFIISYVVIVVHPPALQTEEYRTAYYIRLNDPKYMTCFRDS